MNCYQNRLKLVLATLLVLVLVAECTESRCYAWPIQIQGATDSKKQPPAITILQLPDGQAKLTSRQASFLLGKNLAYLVALKSRGYPEEKLAGTYAAVEGLSKALQIEVPELPEIDGLEDFGTGTRYLLKDEKCVRSQLLEKQGGECAGLFELAANLMLTPTIYAASVHSDAIKKVCDTMLQEIEQATKDANFKHKEDSRNAVKIYCDWIRDGKPAGSELTETMLDTYAQLESRLKAELVEDEVLRAAKKARGKAGDSADHTADDDSKALVSPNAFTFELVHSRKLDGSVSKNSPRFVAFHLGKNLLYLITLLRNNIDPDQEEIDKCRASIQQLTYKGDLQIPELPSKSLAADVWAGFDYLVDAGDSIKSIVEKRHGEHAAAAFEMSSILMLTPRLYSSDFSDEKWAPEQKIINQFLVQRLSTVGKKLDSHDGKFTQAIQPTIDWMQQEKPAGKEHRTTLWKSIDAVDALLKEEWVQQLAREIEAERAK